jgi:hypothetical protein
MINLSKLPTAPVKNLKCLPESPGIYLALDGANRVWYVGSSENLRSRLSSHNKLDEFLDNGVDKIAYFISDNLKEDESEVISDYDPPLNSKNDYRLPYAVVDNLTSQQCLERYVEVKNLIKELESEVDMLKPNVISYIEDNSNDGNKYVGKKFRAYIQRRANYSYSSKVQKLEAQLKGQKKKEVEDGVAVVESYTVYPMIRLI